MLSEIGLEFAEPGKRARYMWRMPMTVAQSDSSGGEDSTKMWSADSCSCPIMEIGCVTERKQACAVDKQRSTPDPFAR